MNNSAAFNILKVSLSLSLSGMYLILSFFIILRGRLESNIDQWHRLTRTLYSLAIWTDSRQADLATQQPMGGDKGHVTRQLQACQRLIEVVEVKRPMVDQSLEAGRGYIKDEGLDINRLEPVIIGKYTASLN